MKYHLIGIGGIGMSGLAEILKDKGHKVKGSNIIKNENCERLEKLGIKIFYNHSKDNIDGDEIVVYSSAIKDENEELDYARSLELKVVPRGKMLSTVLKSKKVLAISGSHGKTSSTSILGQLVSKHDPLVIVGGIVDVWKSNVKLGKGDIAVVEVDESDNSFLYLKKAKYSVITNIDYEHMDFHKNIENLEQSFEKFIQNSELAIVNIDNSFLKELSKKTHCITYSLKENANIVGKIIDYKSFELFINNESLGVFQTNIRGEHNFSNLLPLIYISLKMDVSLEELKEKIKNLKIAKRRCEVIYDKELKIVDDCAHHPTEVAASLQALSSYRPKRLVLVFQPHRYSRISLVHNLFKDVFKNVDKLYITDIFGAGEENIYNITSHKIIDILENREKVVYVENRDKLTEIIKKEIQNGDLIAFMGLGDIYKDAYKLKEALLNI